MPPTLSDPVLRDIKMFIADRASGPQFNRMADGLDRADEALAREVMARFPVDTRDELSKIEELQALRTETENQAKTVESLRVTIRQLEDRINQLEQELAEKTKEVESHGDQGRPSGAGGSAQRDGSAASHASPASPVATGGTGAGRGRGK